MKKIISLLMAAVLAAAMFAGCSSSSSGTTGTTSGKDGKLNPALEDVRVRQAITKLIDKEAIKEIYGENATVLTSHVNPDSDFYDENLPEWQRDVEGAKELLKEADFDFDSEIKIAYYYTDQTTQDVIAVIESNLNEAGIKTSSTLLSGDLGQLIYVDRQYDMLLCGESAADVAEMYFLLLGAGDTAYFNDILGDREERRELIDKYVDEYNATTDIEEQKKIAATLQENAIEEAAIIPVVSINTLALYNSSKVSFPDSVFEADWKTKDYKFEDWKLLSGTTLNLPWSQQMGIDTLFENPSNDVQSLLSPMIFDRLISDEADGSITCRLAKDYTISEDGLTYTFTLKDAVWSDGEKVKASDVAFSLYAYMADPNSNFSNIAAPIVGSDAVKNGESKEFEGVVYDDEANTISITLSAPNSKYMTKLAGLYILPAHLLGDVKAEEISTYEAYWSKPVGCGQYKIDTVSFPDYCTLVPNETYYGAQPGISSVTFKSYATGGADALTNAIIAGEVDFASGNEVNDLNVAQSITSLNSDVKMIEMTSNYQRQILFNF